MHFVFLLDYGVTPYYIIHIVLNCNTFHFPIGVSTEITVFHIVKINKKEMYIWKVLEL